MSKSAARWWKRQRERAQSVQEEAMAEGSNGKPPVDEGEQEMRERLERDNLIPRKAASPPIQPVEAFAFHERVAALEQGYRDLNTAFGQLRAYALNLGRQEDYTKLTMERNVRAAAADLAVKSLPEDTRGDSALLTTVAGAWLVWLKGGDQA